MTTILPVCDAVFFRTFCFYLFPLFRLHAVRLFLAFCYIFMSVWKIRSWGSFLWRTIKPYRASVRSTTLFYDWRDLLNITVKNDSLQRMFKLKKKILQIKKDFNKMQNLSSVCDASIKSSTYNSVHDNYDFLFI